MIRNDLCVLHCAIRAFNADDRVEGIKSLQLLYRITNRKDMKDIIRELARSLKVPHDLITKQQPQRVGVDLKSDAEELALNLLHPNKTSSTSELVRLVNKYREKAQLELSASDFAIWNRWFSLTLHNGHASSDVEAA